MIGGDVTKTVIKIGVDIEINFFHSDFFLFFIYIESNLLNFKEANKISVCCNFSISTLNCIFVESNRFRHYKLRSLHILNRFHDRTF